jgi:hypothetical protein
VREKSSRLNGPACGRFSVDFGPNVYGNLDGRDFPVSRVTVHIHAAETRGKLQVDAYKREEKLIHHAHGCVGKNNVQLVFSHSDDVCTLAMKLQPAIENSRCETVDTHPLPDDFGRTMPEELLAQLETIEKNLSGTSVVIHKLKCLHNYIDCTDIPVPAVLDFFLTPSLRARTAVFVLKDGANVQECAKWLKRFIAGAEVDKAVMIGPHGHIEPAASCVHIRSFSEVGPNIFPPIRMLSHKLDEVTLRFVSDSKRVFIPGEDMELSLADGRRLGINKLLALTSEPICQHALATLTGNSFGEIWEVTLDTGLAKGAHLVRGQQSHPVKGFKASVRVRLCHSNCTSGAVETSDGRFTVRFSPEDARFPSLRACNRPLKESFDVDGNGMPPFEWKESKIVLGPQNWVRTLGKNAVPLPFGAQVISTIKGTYNNWGIAVLTASRRR